MRFLITGVALLAANPAGAEPGESRWLDRFIDPQDGQLDLSDHLLKYRGLLPVPIIITEPALGYGGGLAALWFNESMEEAGARSLAESGQRAPPSIGALAAVSGGIGLRYLIARKLGLHAGIDVARGPEESAFYIQVAAPGTEGPCRARRKAGACRELQRRYDALRSIVAHGHRTRHHDAEERPAGHHP